MKARLRNALAGAVRSPATWILAGVFFLHVVGIGWGLPASDGWDTDGVAPRDFLPGLAETFTPGHYYTYPPLHLALLAVLTLPITAVGYFRAPSHAIPDLVGELIHPGYMTAIAYVARFVALAMSLGIVVFAGRIAREMRAAELGDRDDPRVLRAGWCAMAVVGLEASLTYYGKTSNLDVPYLFWGMWSLATFARAIGRSEPRLFRRVAIFAVLAVATKDQAYALVLFSVPIALAIARPRNALKELAIATAIAVALFLVADAVVFNPSGFRARVGFLTGPASQDFVEYTKSLGGRLELLVDAVRWFDLQFPHAVLLFAVAGFAITMRRNKNRALALLPLLVAISFTVGFNFSSLRTNARFLIPQAVMLAIYAARAVEELVFASQRGVRIAGRVAVAIVGVLALRLCVAVDANLLFDPRYDAEKWLAGEWRPPWTAETYGLNAYLPPFPPGMPVARVGPEPIAKRSRMPAVEEVVAPYELASQRQATFIVLPMGWAWRYLVPTTPGYPPGRRLPPTVTQTASDQAVSAYFQRLIENKEAYFFTHGSKWELDPWLPVMNIHGTTGQLIWIYARKPGQ